MVFQQFQVNNLTIPEKKKRKASFIWGPPSGCHCQWLVLLGTGPHALMDNLALAGGSNYRSLTLLAVLYLNVHQTSDSNQ